ASSCTDASLADISTLSLHDALPISAGLAKPAYAAHCASCHGQDLQGDHAKGAPSLKDGVWLYEDGSIGSIERTVLYGIRSGQGRSEEHTSELQSLTNLVCRLLLEKK